VAALARLRAWADATRAADAVAVAGGDTADPCPLPSILRRPPPPGGASPAAGVPGLTGPTLDWASVRAGRGGRAVRARLADVAAAAAVERVFAFQTAAASAGRGPADASPTPTAATAMAATPFPPHFPSLYAQPNPPLPPPAPAAPSPSPTPWMTPGGAVKGGGKPARTTKGAAARLAAAAAAAVAASAAATRSAAAGLPALPSLPTAPSGRTYTSRFRGVHQTFPTRRWEAQFRRNGKPTSLGCFDDEGEAARAYDKMQLWCELHGAGGSKGGITNFDPAAYESDLAYLQAVSQDDLVAALRVEGRRQAAARTMAVKRAGRRASSAGSGGRGGGGGGGRGRGQSVSRGETPGV